MSPSLLLLLLLLLSAVPPKTMSWTDCEHALAMGKLRLTVLRVGSEGTEKVIEAPPAAGMSTSPTAPWVRVRIRVRARVKVRVRARARVNLAPTTFWMSG